MFSALSNQDVPYDAVVRLARIDGWEPHDISERLRQVGGGRRLARAPRPEFLDGGCMVGGFAELRYHPAQRSPMVKVRSGGGRWAPRLEPSAPARMEIAAQEPGSRRSRLQQGGSSSAEMKGSAVCPCIISARLHRCVREFCRERAPHHMHFRLRARACHHGDAPRGTLTLSAKVPRLVPRLAVPARDDDATAAH